jgi:hypothetical protein
MKKWLMRLFRLEQAEIRPSDEIPLPFISAIQFGEKAEAFKKSEHWLFFRLLCARIRDENLVPTTDRDAAAVFHGIASAMSQLPNTVDKAIMHKNAILARQDQKQQTAVISGFAGSNGRRNVSRPLSS